MEENRPKDSTKTQPPDIKIIDFNLKEAEK